MKKTNNHPTPLSWIVTRNKVEVASILLSLLILCLTLIEFSIDVFQALAIGFLFYMFGSSVVEIVRDIKKP